MLAAFTFVPTASNAAVPPGRDAVIDVTVELDYRQVRNNFITTHQHIYNRRITKRAIGHAESYCMNINSRSQFCHYLYRFPLGSIVAMGVSNSPVFHRVAIVGGTGVYSNVGGQITAVALSRKIDRVVFNLEGF